LIGVALAALLGVYLLYQGLRGRTIDDHPVCAHCRFDLHGQPEAQPRCPECGSSLASPRSVRIGRVRRRPRLIVTGTLALALSVCLSVGYALARHQGVNWNKHKPARLLIWEISQGQPDTSVMEELLKRAELGSLSATSLGLLASRLEHGFEKHGWKQRTYANALARLLASHGLSAKLRQGMQSWILEVQGDSGRPWSTALGDAFENEFWQERLEQVEFARYLSHICAPRMRLPTDEPLGPGELAPVVVSMGWRGGTTPMSFVFELPGIETSSLPPRRWIGEPNWRFGPLGFIRAAEVGKHRVYGSLTISTAPLRRPTVFGDHTIFKNATASDSSTPELTAQFQVPLEYEVRKRSEGGAEIEPLRRELARSMWIDEAVLCQSDGPPAAQMSLFITAPRAAVAFRAEVFWLQGGASTKIDDFTVEFEPDRYLVKGEHQQTTGSGYGLHPINVCLGLSGAPVVGPMPSTGALVVRIIESGPAGTSSSKPTSAFDIKLPDIPIRQ
jgi:hypothetical protein